jgi:hypothetical protein
VIALGLAQLRGVVSDPGQTVELRLEAGELAFVRLEVSERRNDRASGP